MMPRGGVVVDVGGSQDLVKRVKPVGVVKWDFEEVMPCWV